MIKQEIPIWKFSFDILKKFATFFMSIIGMAKTTTKAKEIIYTYCDGAFPINDFEREDTKKNIGKAKRRRKNRYINANVELRNQRQRRKLLRQVPQLYRRKSFSKYFN